AQVLQSQRVLHDHYSALPCAHNAPLSQGNIELSYSCGRKFLDGEPDRLCCSRKATIAQRLSRPALALAHEQLGGYAVVECRNLAVGRHIDVPTRLVSVRVSARPNDGIGKLAYLATDYVEAVGKFRLQSVGRAGCKREQDVDPRAPALFRLLGVVA